MRIRILLSVFILTWLVLLVRIYYISIKSNAYYDEVAKQNAIKTEYLSALRGVITDVKNRPLSVNILGFSVAIKPHLSSKKNLHILDKEIEYLKKTFPNIDAEKLRKDYIKQDSPYGHDFVQVIDFITYDDMMAHFSKMVFNDNLEIKPTSKRNYPYASLASHIIGYVAKVNAKDIEDNRVAKLTDYIGRTGIEKYYNHELQGIEGKREVKITAYNQEVAELSRVNPKSSDIKLTIDLELQKYIADIFGDDSGVAIVMDVKDGSILAADSFPGYDINQFVQGMSFSQWDEIINNPNHPFTNKIVNGLYPPGSVVKMGMSLAFLDSKKINRFSTIIDSGTFELGGRKFRCWKRWGHGEVDMNKAIRESCDDYYYKNALKVGIDFIAPILERLGFGRKTGVDLPNEFIGIVPSREWKMQKYGKPWYNGETLNTSIGQGNFLVTPLQVAKYTAVMATGKEVTPHFIKAIDDKEITYKANSKILTAFEKTQLPYIQQAMYEVANHPKGTARSVLKQSKVILAAKTGTAQVVGISQTDKKRIKEEDLDYYKRSHAWLTTYGPYDKPRYVVTILAEHGGHGGLAAGPIVVKIYNKLLELGYIKQSK